MQRVQIITIEMQGRAGSAQPILIHFMLAHGGIWPGPALISNMEVPAWPLGFFYVGQDRSAHELG